MNYELYTQPAVELLLRARFLSYQNHPNESAWVSPLDVLVAGSTIPGELSACLRDSDVLPEYFPAYEHTIAGERYPWTSQPFTLKVSEELEELEVKAQLKLMLNWDDENYNLDHLITADAILLRMPHKLYQDTTWSHEQSVLLDRALRDYESLDSYPLHGKALPRLSDEFRNIAETAGIDYAGQYALWRSYVDHTPELTLARELGATLKATRAFLSVITKAYTSTQLTATYGKLAL